MTTSLDEAAFDALLGHLLAVPPRDGDRFFARKVNQAIDARAAYARARRRFWQSFALEVITVAALLAALWILSATPIFAPFAGKAQWGLAPPLLLILLLWIGTRRSREAF